MRPGVHTTISVPRFSSVIWLATPLPPYTATHVSATALANRFTSLLICGAEEGEGRVWDGLLLAVQLAAPAGTETGVYAPCRSRVAHLRTLCQPERAPGHDAANQQPPAAPG